MSVYVCKRIDNFLSMYIHVSQCVAECCRVLQCVAVSVQKGHTLLQIMYTHEKGHTLYFFFWVGVGHPAP